MNLFRRDTIDERIDQLEAFIESEWQPGPADAENRAAERSKARDEFRRRLDNELVRRGMAASIRSQLRRADLKLTVVEYLAIHAVLAVVFGLVGLALRGVIGGGLGVIAGFFAPRIYVTMRQRKRLKDFNDQLADILNLWVNALRAGYSVPQAMEAVANEAPAPASTEFRRVVAEISIGVPMETALNNMLSRINSEDLDLVFTAVNIQREVGGNLAEILDTISETIRERVRIKGEIRTLTAQGRITGMLIGFLPIGLAVLLLVINPSYMGQLFFGPEKGGAYIPGLPIPCGWPMIAVGLTMMSIGLAVITRIVDIEV
ncbi:MAG TPA: type II secretion system F family protein [Aggregatilineales bacterium]|nr:secretion system protein [Chloroflexota bacterium]HPV07746.1 type II secretion system F family protein [Aggregatilineales bacterium]